MFQLLLKAIGGDSFGEAMGQSDHAGRAIGWIKQHIHDMQMAGIGQGGGESSLELSLGCNPRADSAADHVADPFIAPFMDVVEGAFENLPFSGVASIVQHDDDRRLTISHGGREFCSCHLKRAVADQHDRSKRGIGKRSAHSCRDGKSHRGVIGWGEELESPVDMEIGRCKERFSDIGDDEGMFIQQTIEVAEESIQGHGGIRCNGALCHGERCRQRTGRKRREGVGHQCPHEVLKPDRIVAMVFDGHPIGCRMNRAAFRQQGRIGIEIFDIG